MPSRKYPGELSPGAQKNISFLGVGQKHKKGFYSEEEDNDSADFYFNQAIFGKEVISPSPSQSYGSNLYGQPTGGSLGMGNLGLQQPPRSLGGQQLSRSFGSSSIPGHVTPTNTSMPNFGSSMSSGLPPQQPSPNSVQNKTNSSDGQGPYFYSESLLPMNSRAILGTVGRDMKRPLPSGLGMSGFGMSHSSRNFVAQGLMANDTPPSLDLSEFPSLSNRGRQDSGGSSMPSMAGRAAYGMVGMVKQPASESTEFQIHSEDFPALPGSQAMETNNDNSSKMPATQGVDIGKENRFVTEKPTSQLQKRGIQTCPDGTVTNIPAGMVTDQFGMVGLLTFIRAAETDPNLVSLALGSDLTTLGLNLNSPENLYPNFGGPFAETPCRPQDIDFHVPSEYLTNINIRDKLAPIKLNRYGEDLLFYMFYTNGGDVLQLAVAAELHSRDWRYHKEERVWITRPPGMVPVEKTNTYERGTYYFFDAQNWRKVAKEFHLDYDKLEDRPHLPPTLLPNTGQAVLS